LKIWLQLCMLNEAVYSLATTGHCTLPDGFTPAIPIRMGAADRPLLLARDPLDIFGLATSLAGVGYLAFRGTEITSGLEFWQEWATDALSLPLVAFGAGHVHLGFHGVWKSLRQPTIDALAQIGLTSAKRIIVGHSLGGAIATLCWADLGGDLLTFGCPRVGDPAFAKALWDGQTVRIINAPDIVPDVPTDPPFRHGGTVCCVFGPGSFADRKLAHSLASYKIGLEALADNAIPATQ
jgi:hypothetical protein